MGSEVESAGNNSIGSNNWILVGEFRSVQTNEVFVVEICSKLTKQIRIVPPFFICGV